MSQPPPSRAGSHWRTTRWSVVLRSRGDDEEARLALSELCSGYWRPLHAFARRWGTEADEARDLVQGFLADLLERGDLDRVDPARGRFRSFLQAAFGNFLSNEKDRARARKRGEGVRALSLADGEDGSFEPRDPAETPDQAFEREWALSVLARALEAVRSDYAETGKLELFEALRARITPGAEGASLRDLGAGLGLSESAIKVAAHRLRRRYREALRSEVARTIGSDDEVDDELRALFEVLGRH